MSGSGTLYGVGLGPGDPELVTVKAARLIESADVVAYHSARHGRSVARSIAAPYLRPGVVEEQLVYPVTTEACDHPGGYEGALEEFYVTAAGRLMAHLSAGRDVVLLAEGDPLFYSSYMHMHKRISARFRTEIVPGVTSVSAASAALGVPLVEGNDVLTVLPGTLGRPELASRLSAAGGADAAAIMKIGRSFPEVRGALKDSGRLSSAYYVERASDGERQVIERAGDVDPSTVPYMSLLLLPGAEASGHPALETAADDTRQSGPGRVDVVGLGPAGRDWLTPQASAVLSAADDIVGYATYVDRVPANPRQRRHASDNRVEAQRAEFALDLALRGRRVAVVSSGDPGVFAMASVVLEAAASEPRFADVPVCVVPGITAAQAVASVAGAPLGHDYVMLSLSDRLKPWDVIARRLSAAAEADFAIAIYNPASQSRKQQLADARSLLLSRRSPSTPVVIGRAVGTDEQSVTVTTLGEFDPARVDMRCLVIVGSSQSRAVRSGDGTTRVITPRRYPRSGLLPFPAGPDPPERAGDRRHRPRARRQRGALDHDHGDVQVPGGLEFRGGHRAAAVLGDQEADAVVPHQPRFALERVGAAARDQGHARRHRAVGRVDRADEEAVRAVGGEHGQVAAARGEEHALAPPVADSRGRLRDVGDRAPGRVGVPLRAAQHQARDPGQFRGPGGVGGDAAGERVRGVDEVRDALLADERREALGAAESADANRPGRQPGVPHPAR